MAENELLTDDELISSDIVANSLMNRERGLAGTNSYARELGFNPLDHLVAAARVHDPRTRRVAWLDICCGSGRALHDAAATARSLRPGLDVKLVGIDLVDRFHQPPDLEPDVDLICSPVHDWVPTSTFDLITCVHGLHYVGDKLGLLTNMAAWLAPDGVLVASFDPTSIRLPDGRPAGRSLTAALRRAGFEVDTRTRRVRFHGCAAVSLPYRYLGADDSAGPNYTGQPAVHSFYERA